MMISQLQIRCCFSCMSFFLVGKIFQVSLDCFFFREHLQENPILLGKKTRFPVKLFQTRPTHHPNHIQKQGHNLHLNCEHSKPGEPRGTLTGTLVGGKFGDGTANYTGWFIWIPLLGSVIPYNHQATRVLNTAKIHGMLRLKKRPDNSGIRILPWFTRWTSWDTPGIGWYTMVYHVGQIHVGNRGWKAFCYTSNS